jgi:hypothetical protein
MPINPSNLSNYGLFKKFWQTDEGTHDGLAHRGLDEVTPQGVDTLATYALDHEADGTVSAPDARKIDDTEKSVMRAILEHDHYGAFFELDARPKVLEKFALPAADVHPTSAVHHPKDEGTLTLPATTSQFKPAQLASANPDQLPEFFAQEYASRKAYFEGTNVSPTERGLRTLGLLADYAKALWARGETESTERIGHELLDAFEKLPQAKTFGAKDFSGIGWSAAQSLVLGHDVNVLANKFPKAGPTAETTYLAMNDQMAKAMGFVDEYRAAKGLPKAAEEFERKSPLGWILGEESGHTKRGNLDEKKAFATSGLNWGTLLFPGDAEIAKLPPKAGFEFAIDCIDALNNVVQARAAWGDKLEIVDDKGKKLKVEKQVEKDAAGKAVSWSAVFKDEAGNAVAPDKVLGLIKNKQGQVKGDGKASRSLDMWWWGFCDRNTAQRLHKSRFQIPQLDRETIKIKVGDKTIDFPKAEAQKLIDADVPDMVKGESFTGFRFDDEPQIIKLKNGQTLQGRVKDLALDSGPGVTRLKGDLIAIHDAPGRPMLGTIELDVDGSSEMMDVRKLDRIEQKADGTITAYAKDGWPKSITGKLLTEVPWAKAETVEGTKVLKQTDDFVVRGGFTVELDDGSSKRVTAGEVSQIAGESQKDMRLSQYMVWVGQNQGMYATDGSTGVVVSNGMRWVNKIDIREDTGEERPKWAPSGDLAGIEGPLVRQAGDKVLWVQGLYASNPTSDPTSTNFAGWVQVSKSGRIVNEGFTTGQPDFGWGATGNLDWLAKSSFNPYMDPELRLKLFVNGVADVAKLEAQAEALGLPKDWKKYLEPQG